MLTLQQVPRAIGRAARARQHPRARLDRNIVRRRRERASCAATVAESTPLKRWGTPDDVAGAAVFLASPAAAFLTGQTIMVGGGIVM